MSRAAFPVALIILDGWGDAPHTRGNAIRKAHTPYIDSLYSLYPHTTLQASGQAVGLPAGVDGNTETGHLNIGAGSIVYQDLPRINQAIAEGSFHTNAAFGRAIEHVKKHNSTLHLLGLVGSGGVHSNIEHLYALISLAKSSDLKDVMIHAITDGRDSPPTSGINYIRQIQQHINTVGIGKIASIMGRYYAMDRDNRWDRTKTAYQALTQSKGTLSENPMDTILKSYQENITDEFIQPIITSVDNQPIGRIAKNDAVIFFNFRIDRPRQLTKAFVLPKFSYVSIQDEGFDPHGIKYYKSHLASKPKSDSSFDRGEMVENVLFVTMTQYEKGLPVRVAFPPQIIKNPLGKVVAKAGMRQLRMTETEKERFVTFYMNGQREDPFHGEDRIIIPSPPVTTYDTVPEMSAHELTQTLVERIQAKLYDFIIVNYPNADMVAHTGNFTATVTACEVVDQSLQKVVDAILDQNGIAIITADHGNAEEVINLTSGEVDTEHSTFPVPCILVGKQFRHKFYQVSPGILADIAPTALKLLGLEIPDSMSGRPLI